MFIVFEGIDGCGKTTQIFLLASHLYSLSKYNHILITREAYKDRKIREVLKQDESKDKADKLTELFVQDRKEHITDLITPGLNKNVIVISDRYKYSTICFQAAQRQDVNELIKMHDNMPIPDFIFILDVPAGVAFERINLRNKAVNKTETNKFEENSNFLEKTRQNYLKLKELLPEENIILIDGSLSPEKVFLEIKEHLKT
ncbi:MAG: dTMP kinase [Nanoarchaeota archaeon]